MHFRYYWNQDVSACTRAYHAYMENSVMTVLIVRIYYVDTLIMHIDDIATPLATIYVCKNAKSL